MLNEHRVRLLFCEDRVKEGPAATTPCAEPSVSLGLCACLPCSSADQKNAMTTLLAPLLIASEDDAGRDGFVVEALLQETGDEEEVDGTAVVVGTMILIVYIVDAWRVGSSLWSNDRCNEEDARSQRTTNGPFIVGTTTQIDHCFNRITDRM